MRDLVEYKNCPGQYEVDILECLITRLSLMRINEALDEQIILRINLEDVVKTLFSISREQRCRLMGSNNLEPREGYSQQSKTN